MACEATAVRREDLPILYETIQDLTSTLSIHSVIERLLERVLVHLNSEIASILLAGQNDRLRITHARGLPPDVIENTCLMPGEGISGYVFENAESVLIEDIEHDPRFGKNNHERYYTHSAVSVPLRIHGLVMGVLNVNNKHSRQPFGPDDLKLIEAIAGHASVALFNAQRYQETVEKAQRDALTGLANHGHFWSTLEIELKRARRYERDLTLVLLDVDHFKQFNDRHGHRGGDQALTSVARVITEVSRAHDFAARYGGEEFAVLLPETPLAGGVAFAEKLRTSIEGQPFHDAPAGELTVSLGVAMYPSDALDGKALVERADARLYGAKNAGRNRVHSN